MEDHANGNQSDCKRQSKVNDHKVIIDGYDELVI